MHNYPEPVASDPWVALFVYVAVFAALAMTLWASGSGKERTLRLFFLYLTYGLFEQAVKRLTHYALYVYPVRYVLFALVLTSWLAGRQAGATSRRPPLQGLLIAYLVLAAIQMFNPHLGNPVVGLLGWGNDFVFALLYFVAFDVMTEEANLGRFFGVTAWLGILSAAAAFVEQVAGPERLQEVYPTFVPLYSWDETGNVFFRPASLSVFMEVFAIGTMFVLLTIRRERYRRPLLLLGIFVCATASVLHGVRIAWAWILFFGTAFMALNVRRSVWHSIGIAVCVALSVRVAAGLTEGSTLVRLSTVQTPVETFTQNRLGGLLALPTVVASAPFGVGVGRTSPGLRLLDRGSAYAALGTHNYLTDLAGQMSVLGPLLLLVFCAGVLRRGLTAVRRTGDAELRAYRSALLAGVAAYTASFFAGLWLGGSLVTEYFWFLAGASMRLAYRSSAAPENGVAPYGINLPKPVVPTPIMPKLQPSK